MRLFFLSEQFYAAPSDSEYLLALIAAPDEQTALTCARWSVHGDDKSLYSHWDVVDLGEFTPTYPLRQVDSTINAFEIACWDVRIPPLPYVEWGYRTLSAHQIECHGELRYIEDPTAITNMAYAIPVDRETGLATQHEDGSYTAVECRLTGSFKLTGETRTITVGGYQPRTKTVFDVIDNMTNVDTNILDVTYAEYMALVRERFFSRTEKEGWVPVTEKHDYIEIQWWEHPTWRADVLAGRLTSLSTEVN